MSSTLLQPGTSAPAPGASAAAKDPLAGMTLLNAEGHEPRAKAAVEITKNALKRIRVAMAKEGVSPEQGGLRLGVMGGGCSGLSYSIRFDSQPRERDRVFVFGAGVETHERPAPSRPPIADRAGQHREPGLQPVQDRRDRRPRDLHLPVHAGERPQMRGQHHADHGSACTSTESTAGRSRTIGVQVSPESGEQ